MIVYHCAEKIVCSCDRVHIACKVEVYILHRNYLCIAAACCAALHAENRSERRLTEGKNCLFAYPAHSVRKTDADSSLSLACGSRIYSCDKNELAVLSVCQLCVECL